MAGRVGWAERVYWTAYLAARVGGQARLPFQPWPVIERAQRRRLRAMVAHAHATVPYYRETMRRLDLRPDDFGTVEDLARLPIIEADDLRRDPEYFVSTARPRREYLAVTTSGSSGHRRTIYHDTASVLANMAHGLRERAIYTALLEPGGARRELSIVLPNSTFITVSDFCRRHLLLPPSRRDRRTISIFEPTEHLLATLNEFRPRVVLGYGSALQTLFARALETDAPVHRPDVIIYSGDEFAAPMRRQVAERLGTPVFGVYMASEAFKIGFECAHHTGLHVNADLYPLRVVGDHGETLPAGESGQVVLSNLVNRGTVLLNYRLGDVSAFRPEPCACGRTLPVLASLHGRSDDSFPMPSGRVILPLVIREMVWEAPGIKQYHVEQQTLHRIVVSLVPTATCDRARAAAHVRAHLAGVLDAGVAVEVCFVESIARLPGGKIRAVRSRVGRAAPA